MKQAVVIALVVSMVLIVTGCASISDTAKAQLTKPVDCSTASYDIQILQGEKASVAKQTRSGLRSIVPTAAVVGIISGDYKDRVRVASGQYNKDINAKIEQIKDTCGVK